MNSVRRAGLAWSELIAGRLVGGRCVEIGMVLVVARHEKNRRDVAGCGMGVCMADSDGTVAKARLDNPLTSTK